MAERRKNRKKKELPEATNDNGKPTKEECAVAKYIRQRLPEKKTSLLGHKVEYFIASKAIDCLLDSPWARKSGSEEALFTTRESVVMFMDRMLQHKFFHRARKIIVNKDLKKKKKDKDGEEESGKEKEKEKEKESSKKPAKVKKDEKEEKSRDSDKAEEKKEGDADKKKEKKKIKLDMHLEQLFVDGNEVYVWIYDPIPMRTWIIGMLMVAGAVLVCLFPLWPQVIRTYIYYLSVAAALFLVFIIGLAIIRLIVFVLVWSVSFGKHHLWLLPNLTEDVGFLDSFWPLYHYEYKGKKEDGKSEKEDEAQEEEEEAEKNNEKNKSDSSSEAERKGDQANSESERDSDEDKAKTDNGFEILDAEEEES